MEKNIIRFLDKEMYFCYYYGIREINSWINPISFGYYKINFFIEVDAKIIIENVCY